MPPPLPSCSEKPLFASATVGANSTTTVNASTWHRIRWSWIVLGVRIASPPSALLPCGSLPGWPVANATGGPFTPPLDNVSILMIEDGDDGVERWWNLDTER